MMREQTVIHKELMVPCKHQQADLHGENHENVHENITLLLITQRNTAIEGWLEGREVAHAG